MKSFRCPPDLNEEVDELAYLERRTWTSICIEALEKFVAEKKRARIDGSKHKSLNLWGDSYTWHAQF